MKEDPDVKFFVEPASDYRGFIITRELEGTRKVFKEGTDGGFRLNPRFIDESTESIGALIYKPYLFGLKNEAIKKAKELKDQFFNELQAARDQEEFIKNNPPMEV